MTNRNLLREATDRIFDRWGDVSNGSGIDHVPITSRTVISVYSVIGIVKNGGFSYLLGSAFAGDEDLKHCIAAFRRIGCDRSADIIADVLSTVGAFSVERSLEGRYRKYKTMPQAWRDTHDRDFWDTGEEIKENLTRYIRDNWSVIDEEVELPKGWELLDQPE